MRLRPDTVHIIGDELAIRWNDGVESFLSLPLVRRACPCAACGGEPDLMGEGERPVVTYTAKSFRIESYQLIGGYAFQPVWEDGHSSGLYSFDLLRRLATGVAAPAPSST